MATQKYDKKGSIIINHCCLYLWLISIFELLTFALSQVNPFYKDNKIPPLRSPNIYWPQFEKPPRHYWQLWHHFIRFHVEPYIASLLLTWDAHILLRLNILFFTHRHHFHLYKLDSTDLLEYRLVRRTRWHSRVSHITVPYISNISPLDPNLIPVDVFHTKQGFSTCGWAKSHTTPIPSDIEGQTLRAYFSSLPMAIQQICGTITFPTDNGVQMVSKCRRNNNKVFGASDASFQQGSTTHAWVILSGEISDLETPNMTISGCGAVDGYPIHMSSGRGELHGITVLSIMTDVLYNFHSFTGAMTAVCDNQGVIKKCDNPSTNNLWRQRETNNDLYITQQYYKRWTNMKLEWVKGHTDKLWRNF